MSKTMCPGQDTRFWKPGDVFEVPCAECGFEIEFFKDDAVRRCRRCGNRVRNPRLNIGCAQWCQHAKECLGFDPQEAISAADAEEAAVADRLIAALKRSVGQDQTKISQALIRLEHAQEILHQEGGQPKVVLAAALLLDVETSKATRLLKDVGLDDETVAQVERILEPGPPAPQAPTLEARIVRDAEGLANLSNQNTAPDQEKAGPAFKTKTGQELARRLHA